MTALEIFFLSCAIVGGVFFILRAVLFFYGVGGEIAHDGFDMGGNMGDLHTDGIDLHGDIHADSGDFDASHGNTDMSFKFLSIQGISAFLTIFGLVGFAGLRSEWNLPLTFGVGILGGGVTVFLIGLIFKGMQKLQSDGTINLENAVGQEGNVYLSIPAGGIGKVNVVIQGALKEYNAMATDENTKISTGEAVRVVRVTPDHLLIVEKRNLSTH